MFSNIVDLLENCEEGLGTKFPENNGTFDKTFLKAYINSKAGDNDYDYELGRIGYCYLTSDEGLKKLAEHFLEKVNNYPENFFGDVLVNCKNSLQNIINTL
jgi:hypothetical protein